MDKNTLYLFDTNVVMALLRGQRLGTYLNEVFSLSEVINRPLISIVSHGELRAMAKRNNWGEKKLDALREALNELVTLDLNDPAIIDAYIAVDSANQSHPKGARQLSDNDKWIAATAKAAGALLLTTDQDFLHLHGKVCQVHYVDPSSKAASPSNGEQQRIQ